ncbi:MAG: protein arginine kinase [Planctomycetes bacterium]|nr:protein arginine kinase [Planctomycetota bacterium]
MSGAKGRDPGTFQLGEWLHGEGPNSDIAVCTRVRFARNVRGFRFSTLMDGEEAKELVAYIDTELTRADFLGEEYPDTPENRTLRALELGSLEDLDRRLLVERHLISRELAGLERARSVAVNPTESVAIMVNEEDHLRAQTFRSGFRLEDAYRRAELLDEALLRRLPLAFSEEFGFLTACPTNTGTGLRVSVMLHLPGLVWADEIEKATSTAQKIHLAVRGLYGEGSRALGDFYQVSNQVTLGRTEEQLLEDVHKAVERLIAWEREARAALLRGEAQVRTEDRVFRALGTLERARTLTSEEALTFLSAVRLGVQQGLIEGIGIPQLNRALLLSQPAHLQRLCMEKLSPVERDQRRAALIRDLLRPKP